MTDKKKKYPVLAARVPQDLKESFADKAEVYGRTPSDMLRQLVAAFTEGRLRIVKPQNAPKDIYNEH